MPVEHAGENEARHEERRLVGPAEYPPHLDLRALLGRVVRMRRDTGGMDPDRSIELGHRREERREAQVVEREVVHVRVYLDAEGAELAHRALRLVDGAVGVVHRQRGRETDEALMLPAELGDLVVRPPRELDGVRRRAERLDRRMREREDLAVVVAELL